MKLSNNQVKEYLECWVYNHCSEDDIDVNEIVDDAFLCNNALVDWKFKKDRWDEYPEYDYTYACKVVSDSISGV